LVSEVPETVPNPTIDNGRSIEGRLVSELEIENERERKPGTTYLTSSHQL